MENLLSSPKVILFIGIFVVIGVLYYLINKAIPIVYALTSKSIKMKSNCELSLSKQKAIACGANLSSQNGLFLNTLETGAPKQTVAVFLHKNWDLKSKPEIIETLERLYNEPQTILFEYISEIRKNFPKHEWKQQIHQRLTDEERDEYEQDMVLSLYSFILEAEKKMQEDEIIGSDRFIINIDAYNLSRGINIVRWSHQLQYINENEAWEYINRMAEKMYSLYTSWEEISASYILGRLIFSDSIDEFYEMQLSIHNELLKDQNSPWVIIKY